MFSPSGCKDSGMRTFKFVTRTQFLCKKIYFFLPFIFIFFVSVSHLEPAWQVLEVWIENVRISWMFNFLVTGVLNGPLFTCPDPPNTIRWKIYIQFLFKLCINTAHMYIYHLDYIFQVPTKTKELDNWEVLCIWILWNEVWSPRGRDGCKFFNPLCEYFRIK